MKRKLTLTIDEDVYDWLGELPRKVSISEVVTWILRGMIEDVKPGGMSNEEFIKFMDSDPRGKDVRKYLQEKLGPMFDKVDEGVGKVKKTLKPKKGKE